MLKIIWTLIVGLVTSIILAALHQILAALIVAILTVAAVVAMVLLARRGIRRLADALDARLSAARRSSTRHRPSRGR